MSSNEHFPPQELPRLHKNGGLPAAQLLTLVASSFPFALIPISIVTTYLYSLFRKKLRTLRRRRVMPSSTDDVIPEGTQSIHSNTDSTHGPGRRKSSPAFETLDETSQYPQEYRQADEGTSPEQVQPPPPPPLAPLEPPDNELTGTTQLQYTIPKPAPVKRLVEMPPAVVLHKSRKVMSRGQSPGQSQTQNRVGFSRMEDSGSGSGSGLQWKNESFFKLSPINVESSRWEFHPENFKFLSNEFLNSNPRSSSRFGHKPAVSLTGITVVSPFESNPFLMRAVLSNDMDNDGHTRDDDNDVDNNTSELNLVISPPPPQPRNLPYILPIVGTTRSKENRKWSFPIAKTEIGVMTQVSATSSPTRKVTMAMTSRSTGFETEKQPPLYANKSSSSPKFQDFSGRRQVLMKIKDAPAQVPSPPPTTAGQSKVSSPWAWNPSPPSFCPIETNHTLIQNQSKGHDKSMNNLNEKLSRKNMFVEPSSYPPEKRRKDAKSVGIATLPILQSSMASETERFSKLVSKASSVSGISKKEMKSATTDGVLVEQNLQTDNYLQNVDTATSSTTADHSNVKSVGSDLADCVRAQGTGEEHMGPLWTNSRETDTEEILLDDKSTQVYKLMAIPPPISVPVQNLSKAERLDVGNETDKIQQEDAQEQSQVNLQATAKLEEGQGQTSHVSTNSSSTNTDISKREVEGQVTPPQQSEKGQMSESHAGSRLANLQQCSLPLLCIIPESDLVPLEQVLDKAKEIDPDSEKEEQDQVEEDEEDAENTPEDPWDFSPHVYTTESGCKQDTGTEIEGKQKEEGDFEETELEAKHFKLPKATDSMLILLSSPKGEESGEQEEKETEGINALKNEEQVMEPCAMRNGELIEKDKISRAAKSLTHFLLASYPSSQLTSICTSKSTHCLDHHDTGTTMAKPTKTLATNTLVNCDDGSTDRKYEKSRLLEDQSILSMRMKRLRDDKNAMLDKTAGILAYFSLEKSCIQMKLHPPLNGEQPSSYVSGSNYNSRNNHSVNTNYPLALDCEKLIISPCDCTSKSEAKPKVKLKASEVDKNTKICNNESLQQPQGQSSTSNNYKSYYDYLKNRQKCKK